MSSSPKGERITLDAYYTPDDIARLCVSTLDLSDPGPILEPSVGGGAFVRALRPLTGAKILGIDADPEAAGLALCDGRVPGFDFLQFGSLIADRMINAWVIGNPPYNNAEAHVRHALTLAPRCAFLLRLAFLESIKRADFWRDHQPSEVFVLAKRPSFTVGATDSCAYGWFVWDRTKPGPTRLDILTPDGPLWSNQ